MNNNINNDMNSLIDPILSKLKTDPRYEEDNTKRRVALDDSNAGVFDALEDAMKQFLNESGNLCRNLYSNMTKLNTLNTNQNNSGEGV